MVYTKGDSVLPPTFGNFESVRSLLADDKQQEEFSFAVVGDTRGCGTFERIIEALKDEPLSFMVILGDCVNKGTTGNHQYFISEISKELITPFPIFFSVGNHDIDNNDFTINKFERIYGPTNFSFEYQKNLFIALRILPRPYPTEESIAFFESTLISKRNNYNKVFVFLHVPPPVSSDFLSKDFNDSKKFVELCDKFNVDYAIAGDFHAYARAKVKNTIYLVTAGGGAYLAKVKFGKFHHAMVIHVGKDSISERILYVDRYDDILDHLELLAFADIFPFFKNHLKVILMINTAVIIAFIWLVNLIQKDHPN